MNAKRMQPVICVEDPARTRDFYTRLLDFDVSFDSEWYVQLSARENPELTLAIHHRDHARLHGGYCRASPGALYLSLEVEDVDAVCERAREMGADILEQPGAPGMGDYDRRRLLLLDPGGVLLEITQPGDPDVAARAEILVDA